MIWHFKSLLVLIIVYFIIKNEDFVDLNSLYSKPVIVKTPDSFMFNTLSDEYNIARKYSFTCPIQFIVHLMISNYQLPI